MSDILDLLKRRRPKSYSGRNIAVAGLYRNRSGLQRGAELTYLKLRQEGANVCKVDISLPGAGTLHPTDLLEPHDLAELPITDLIVHENPSRYKDMIALMPERVIRDAAIIAFWTWEAQKFPASWKENSEFCDEIWCPSPFVAEALFSEMTNFGGKIRIIPYPAAADPIPCFEAAQKILLRAKYGLDARDFIVGFTFSFESNYGRKNPVATIDAFRLAFSDPGARSKLLIRCNDGRSYPHLLRHLTSYAAGDDRIKIIDPQHVSWPIPDFYNCLNVYLSLHRGEGYGLSMVEASQAGADVIATAWGLAPDIARLPGVQPVDYRLVTPLDPQQVFNNIEGAEWAEPDIMQAARYLRRLYNSTEPARLASNVSS